MRLKQFVYAVGFALGSVVLAGCVSEPYDVGYGGYYDGYRNYEPYDRGGYYRDPYYYNGRGWRGDRWRDGRYYRRPPDRDIRPDRPAERPRVVRVQPNYVPPGRVQQTQHSDRPAGVPPTLLPGQNFRR